VSNQWIGWGNLTREPELRYFENGSAVCNTGMAINKTWTNDKGEKQESVEFLDLSIWGKMGENVAESLTKGDRVLVVGAVKIRRVEQEDGTKRQFAEINVKEIGTTLRWATCTSNKNERTQESSFTTPEAKF
jgi:single-strand DNA-binding protein